MSVVAILIFVTGIALAFANGGNDVSKGIATLVGSGVTDYRRAILWGTGWTAVGGLFGFVLARAMLSTFGNGLLGANTAPTLVAALSTLLGASMWVFLATRLSLPVSTTHAIVGSLVGVAVFAYGANAVQWHALFNKIALPLLLSPLIALGLTALVLSLTRRRWQSRYGRDESAVECICAELEPAVAFAPLSLHRTSMAFALDAQQLHLSQGSLEACAADHPRAARLTVDHLHWLTSGATSFGRGLNDAPKIVALLLSASALSHIQMSTAVLYAAVSAAMVAGSALAGRRITHVLAEKVTSMDHHDGFCANLVTSGLVISGAVLGLPMSTTHVSSGGIIGVGLRRGELNTKTLRQMALAWCITLPAAALLGAGSFALLGRLL